MPAIPYNMVAFGLGKGTLFMPDWESRSPYVWLIAGVISLFLAVVGTCTGRTCGRYRGSVYRAKEPKEFWWLVAIYYLGAVLFIGLFLNAVHAL
jgi:hypothetical protein